MVVAGQPHPLVLMAVAPFAVRVCRALLVVLTPSRWSPWRVLLPDVVFGWLLLVSPSRWCSWRVLLSLAYTDAPIGYVYTRHMSQPHSNARLA